jgi:hypothetical protein
LDQSRRKFFGIGAAAVAAAAIPTGAVAGDKTVDEAIGPIILEHVCDGGKSHYTPKEVAEFESYGPRQWGCGTRFRWYFGVPPYCPKCGRAYEMTLAVLESGVYKRVS